jgi:hypothetical protein
MLGANEATRALMMPEQLNSAELGGGGETPWLVACDDEYGCESTE